MPTENLTETIKRELPGMLRKDPELRRYILDLTRGLYADRLQTEDRFDRILDELRRDREAQTRKWEEQANLWREQNRKWEESRREQAILREEQNRKWEESREEQASLWQEQNRKWEESREEQNRKWEESRQEQASLREEQNRKWEESRQEQASLREEQNRKWEKSRKEQAILREEQNRKWEESRKEFAAVHEEIMAQAKKVDRSIGALGSRWGLQSEAAFRNALAGILEESFGVKVRNVIEFDDQGEVFGRPDQVELDILVKDGLLLIVELKSSIDKAGMYSFERKARFYEKRHQRHADRLIVISPMVEPRALAVARDLGIETYSDSVDVPGA